MLDSIPTTAGWPVLVDVCEASRRVAIADRDDDTILLVDLDAGGVIASVEAEGAFGFDAQGERLLVVREGRACVVDLSTAAVMASFATEGVHLACWAPRGSRVATAREATVHVWDAVSGELLETFECASRVERLTFDAARDRIGVVCLGEGRAFVFALDGAPGLVLDHREATVFWWPGRDHVSDIAFDGDERIVTASAEWFTVSAWDAAGGEALWHFDSGRGNPTTLRARFEDAGSQRRRVRVSGGWNGYLDAETGEAWGLPQEARWRSRFVGDSWLVQGGLDGVTVRDAKTFEVRYRMVPCTGGDWMLRTPEGYVDGTPRALREVHVKRVAGSESDRKHWPVDSFPWLFDPLRVRAAAAGMPLAAPRLGAVPTLLSVQHTTERRPIGDRVHIEATARGGHGELALVLSADGTFVAAARTRASEATPGEARFRLALDAQRLADAGTVVLRVRDAAGAQSRPHYLRLR